ncbi:Peflin, partial [Frankliniella fusca]
NLGGLNTAQMNYGGDQHGGYGSQQPGAYGGNYYGGQQPGNYQPQNPSPGMPGAVSPEVQQWFNAVDRDRSGKITAKELQAALVNGQGKNFSDQACNLMIGMFDSDKTGTIDINEFQQLYNYINQWLGTFRSYDRDQSGFIDETELAQAFQQMGFRFSPEFIKFLITKSDMQNHAKISVDQFIVLCVQVQRFTDNGTNISCCTIDPPYDKAKRKRKLKDDSDTLHVRNGLEMQEYAQIDSNQESETSHSNCSHYKLRLENEKLKDDMNQLVTDNVQLLKENKQLQEDNSNLERQVKFLEEENKRLCKEHKEALELSSWLSSAKEIVETLRKRPLLCTKPARKLPSVIRPADIQTHLVRPSVSVINAARHFPEPRTPQWVDDTPHANGTFVATHIKMERPDDEQLPEGQDSPYHTPLLNFDQVDFHSAGKDNCDISNSTLPDMTVPETIEDEVDRIGREQLLFPDPVEGVCELCPGSRIYVALSAMDNILNKKSHSSVARSCLEAIFKMPYLLSCSVQGNVAKGPYGKPDVQRPSLYRPAVECILKYARFHAEQNSWKVEENTTIKKQMNTRLSELRNIAKYKAQATGADAGDPDGQNKGYSRYKNIVAALSALPIVAQPSTSDIPTESNSRNDLKSSISRAGSSEFA